MMLKLKGFTWLKKKKKNKSWIQFYYKTLQFLRQERENVTKLISGETGAGLTQGVQQIIWIAKN